jgi:hypothetical protein
MSGWFGQVDHSSSGDLVVTVQERVSLAGLALTTSCVIVTDTSREAGINTLLSTEMSMETPPQCFKQT